MIDYQEQFPIPAMILPPRLRALLEPVGYNPALKIEVTTRWDQDQYGPNREYVHMIMAVVPEGALASLGVVDEASNGVVSFSVPDIERQAGLGQRGNVKPPCNIPLPEIDSPIIETSLPVPDTLLLEPACSMPVPIDPLGLQDLVGIHPLSSESGGLDLQFGITGDVEVAIPPGWLGQEYMGQGGGEHFQMLGPPSINSGAVGSVSAIITRDRVFS